jgi:hypothetical protein
LRQLINGGNALHTHVILSVAKDLKMRSLRSFVVFATQDDVTQQVYTQTLMLDDECLTEINLHTVSFVSGVAAIQRLAVNSTVIASIGYDPNVSTLEIEFKTGRIYRYFLVPEWQVAKLRAAASVGAYFNEVIRPQYPCREVS